LALRRSLLRRRRRLLGLLGEEVRRAEAEHHDERQRGEACDRRAKRWSPAAVGVVGLPDHGANVDRPPAPDQYDSRVRGAFMHHRL
jgi:hypothetical protein